MVTKKQKWPRKWSAKAPGKRCPNCGLRTGRPILRGMPTGEVVQAVDDGEIDVFLAGCIVGPDDPTHHCSNCDSEFG